MKPILLTILLTLAISASADDVLTRCAEMVSPAKYCSGSKHYRDALLKCVQMMTPASAVMARSSACAKHVCNDWCSTTTEKTLYATCMSGHEEPR